MRIRWICMSYKCMCSLIQYGWVSIKTYKNLHVQIRRGTSCISAPHLSIMQYTLVTTHSFIDIWVECVSIHNVIRRVITCPSLSLELHKWTPFLHTVWKNSSSFNHTCPKPQFVEFAALEGTVSATSLVRCCQAFMADRTGSCWHIVSCLPLLR